MVTYRVQLGFKTIFEALCEVEMTLTILSYYSQVAICMCEFDVKTRRRKINCHTHAQGFLSQLKN